MCTPVMSCSFLIPHSYLKTFFYRKNFSTNLQKDYYLLSTNKYSRFREILHNKEGMGLWKMG